MPVIKPILSFTLFLLLRRGVLFFIREKIYILKAPCSRNKHDFGRTFRKTVCRRLSVRQSCGACVAVQGRKRGRRCRLSSDKPRRNTRRRGEQAPFRAAELWRRRFLGAPGGFASFCGGNLRASSGRGDVRRREMCSLRCESPTAALSLALSIGDGGGRLCRSVKIWKAGERRGAARAGRDAERERARLLPDEPRRDMRCGPCMRDDMFPEVSGGLAVKTGRHVDVAAGDVDAFGMHVGKTGAVGQDDVVAFRPGAHDGGSPVFRASFVCDAGRGVSVAA